MIKTIILDTNFLMIPGQFGIDIFSELARLCAFRYKLAVVDRSLEELASLAGRRGKAGAAARLALGLARQKALKIIKTKARKADEAVLQAVQASPKLWVVATQDRALKARLRALGVAVISLRAKAKLILG